MDLATCPVSPPEGQASSAEWFGELEAKTEPFRRRKAVRHGARARMFRAWAEVGLQAFQARASALAQDRIAIARRKAFWERSAAFLRRGALGPGFGEEGWDDFVYAAAPAPASAPAETSTTPASSTPRAPGELLELVAKGDDEALPLVLEHAEARLRSARWHDERAGGQLRRFESLRHCGQQLRRIECTCCGTVRDLDVGCEIGRLCVRCRAKEASSRCARFGRARARIMRNADRLGLLRAKQWGGYWSEKFLTLTVPHFERRELALGDGDLPMPDHLVGERIEVTFRAWRWFALQVKAHLRRCPGCRRREADGKRGPERPRCGPCRSRIADGKRPSPGCLTCEQLVARKRRALEARFAHHCDKCEDDVAGGKRPRHALPCLSCAAWRDRRRAMKAKHDGPDFTYRAFEWTPGGDGYGHPHLHCWVFAPYLSKPLLRRFWRRALTRAGLQTVDAYMAVVLDIRSIASRPQDFHRELVKRADAIKLARLTIAGNRNGGESVVAYADGWSLADVDKEGRRVPVDVAAQVYEALEAKRIVQTSPHLLDVVISSVCSDCGEDNVLRVYLILPDGEPSRAGSSTERGPPPAPHPPPTLKASTGETLWLVGV